MNFQNLIQNRKISQIGIVVEDLEASVKEWVEEYDVGPWTILTHSSEYLTETKTSPRGAAKEWTFYIALAMAGDIQIELVEPVYGLPLYEDFLKKHGDGAIHHFKEIMPNEELDKVLEEYERRGIEILFGGNFFGARFYYPDTISMLGTQIELGNGAAAQIPESYPHKRVYPAE